MDDVLTDGSGFLPDGLRETLKEFVYMYRPQVHLNVAAFVCRRGGEVTVSLIYNDETVFDACLRACVGAARAMRVNAVDAVDACRRECRGAVDELIRQDVDAGIKMLKDLLERANFAYRVEAKTDSGAVVKVRP